MKIEVTSEENEIILDALALYAKTYFYEARDAENRGNESARKIFMKERDLARALQKKIFAQKYKKENKNDENSVH